MREAIDRGADAVGMAGGDGSLAVVAAAASAQGLPFVCVPAGTRNHFARDLGVARRDIVGALDAFTEGLERRIDVGEVNGRLFLNNVSFGVYGDAVQRPDYRSAKLRVLLETAEEVLGPSGSAPPLRIVDDRGREHAQPAVLLVSNNPYAVDRPVAPGPGFGSTRGALASWCSTGRTNRPTEPLAPGPHRPCMSTPPRRCTRASTARRSRLARRCRSRADPAPCGCGSRRAISERRQSPGRPAGRRSADDGYRPVTTGRAWGCSTHSARRA